MPTQSLRFGIPSLDQLLAPDPSIMPIRSDVATSISIAGSDGSGKSILALHLASHYAATTPSETKVIYVSTDLPSSAAQLSWFQFALHSPSHRIHQVPFLRDAPSHGGDFDRDVSILLQPYSFGETLLDFLTATPHPPQKRTIAFVELRSDSTGDDWGFLNRLIATLPAAKGAKHLVIIDALDGLELLTGRHDVHGEALSLRSHLAQLLQSAQKTCHVLALASVGDSSTKPVFELLSDVAIRLHTRASRDYKRRTLEVIKARGCNPVRGEHVYYIRSGLGSSTGTDFNPDDPFVRYPQTSIELLPQVEDQVPIPISDDDLGRPMAYVHVCRSNHRRYREEMLSAKAPYLGSFDDARVGFGIKHLDDLLGRPDSQSSSSFGTSDSFGWPAGRVCAVIGDQGTSKSKLGTAFLAQCFDAKLESKYGPGGIAVLLTNRDESADSLSRKIAAIVGRSPSHVRPRVICRRLEVHDMTSAVLSHILWAALDEAKLRRSQVTGLRLDTEPAEEFMPWQIRLVIDDWTVIRDMYVDLANDELFLPYTMFRLNRDRVSSVFIATQPGRPDRAISDERDIRFRVLQDRQLFLWRVPFFGSRRTAVSHPGQGEWGTVVRELRMGDDGRLEVDPHFELYSGLLQGNPVPVPLRIRLYAQTEMQSAYAGEVERFFRTVFSPPDDGGGVIQIEATNGYEVQRLLPYLQSERRLDHTLLLQIDEFSALGRDGQVGPGLSDLRDYLGRDYNKAAPQFDDEGLRLEHPSSGAKSKLSTLSSRGFTGSLDRVPFTWDFSFLLLREDVWRAALASSIGRERMSCGQSLEEVWRGLRRFRFSPELDGIERASCRDSETALVSWRHFLEACTVVARSRFQRGEPHPIAAFDLSLSPESFSSMVLEIWASEIVNSLGEREGAGDVFIESLSKRRPGRSPGILSWLEGDPSEANNPWRGHRIELYKTWMLLIEALRYTEFCSLDSFEFERRLSTPTAIAARHNYSTACEIRDRHLPGDSLTPCRLPGMFSVRSDWSLAVARGSRSQRLGHLAIDLLTSARASEARLRHGLGLPLSPDAASELREEDSRSLQTALFCLDDLGRKRHAQYGDLLRLGEQRDPEGFYWLWRSNLSNYASEVRPWQRWLHETLVWLRSIQRLRGKAWTTGFQVYDWATDGELSKSGRAGQLESFLGFPARCDALVAALAGPDSLSTYS